MVGTKRAVSNNHARRMARFLLWIALFADMSKQKACQQVPCSGFPPSGQSHCMAQRVIAGTLFALTYPLTRQAARSGKEPEQEPCHASGMIIADSTFCANHLFSFSGTVLARASPRSRPRLGTNPARALASRASFAPNYFCTGRHGICLRVERIQLGFSPYENT